ncbi:hypothetical protein MKW94_015611 [Papaver nudicaule]|uniref:Uncharacterized protein n=1 Tax=Papaver nudicaule TaxID=74823 RepID=A0AA41V9Y4_PAPNU|nr:hypothetical protein [Papaver nudicaule]MCL7036484.1 hypothetical protein [Papaver nudicaule]
MTTISTANRSRFFNVRGNSSLPESRVRASRPHGSSAGKVDSMAMWFVNGISTAFFASLEKCSCINVTTHDDGYDSNEDLPLIPKDEDNFEHHNRATGIRRRRNGKGKTIDVR